MIEVRNVRRGSQRAVVTCDVCRVACEEYPVKTGEDRVSRGDKGSATIVSGQVSSRLTKSGWRVTGNRHICPGCQPARATKEQDAAEKGQEVVNDLVPAEITRETRRKIRSLLDEVYDVDAGRYRGAETDLTVAETVGGGCLVEWVCAERKEGYGDGAGNEAQSDSLANLGHLIARVDEELEAIATERAQMLGMVKDAETLVRDSYGKAMSNLNALRDQIDRARKDVSGLAKRFPKAI